MNMQNVRSKLLDYGRNLSIGPSIPYYGRTRHYLVELTLQLHVAAQIETYLMASRFKQLPLCFNYDVLTARTLIAGMDLENSHTLKSILNARLLFPSVQRHVAIKACIGSE